MDGFGNAGVAGKAAEEPRAWSRETRERVYAVASVVTFIVGWQIASYFAPSFAVPSWERIIGALFELKGHDAFVTVARIVVSMVFSFIIGLAFSIAVFERPAAEAFFLPFVRLLMAVPALCWVVFSILWFKDVELRIFFVMVVVCAPIFVIDSLDAMKAVSPELRQMVDSFRPRPIQRFTKIVLPGIIPNLLTSWKINFTMAVRVVTTAELVGALTGIGHGLVIAQEMFSVAQVFAWTLVLVIILFAFEAMVGAVEKRVLKWRHA